MTTSASIIDLSSGSGPTSVLAINNEGQILLATTPASQSTQYNKTTTFSLWSNGSQTVIGTLDVAYFQGTLNDLGTAVIGTTIVYPSGYLSPTSNYVWQNGNLSQLKSIYGFTTTPVAADGSGNIYGNSYSSAGAGPAFVYQDGAFQLITNSTTTSTGSLVSLKLITTNAGGDLIAQTTTDGHSYLLKGGAATDLGSTAPSFTSIYAHAINARDEIVGSEQVGSDYAPSSAFLWHDGKMTVLAPLGSYENLNYATAINDEGLAVGTCGAAYYYPNVAVVWQNGTAIDLNSLLPANSGWVLTSAAGINDAGQVIGYGNHNGVSAVFELTLPTFTYSAATVAGEQGKGLVSSVTAISDSAADVSANLDALAAVAAEKDLGTVTLTDPGTPALSLSVAQVTADAAVLKTITGPYTLAITDTAADVTANLDSLQALVTAKTLSAITLTDGGIPMLSLTAAQLTSDAGALADISGDYTISVTAPASGSASIAGLSGHGTIVSFGGTAASYAITASGDGSSLTVGPDHLSTITALQFSDYRLFVASTTPSAAGAVSSAEVADLYAAVFARTPDVAGLAYYEAQAAADPTRTITSFAENFLSSPEYTGNAAHAYAQSADGDAKFITDTYQNLLHRAPTSADVAWYQANVIDPILGNAAPGTSAYTQASLAAHATLLADFSQSAEFLNDVQVTSQHPADGTHWLVLI